MSPSVVVSCVSNVSPSCPTPQPCHYYISNFGLIYGPSPNIPTKAIFYYKRDESFSASYSEFKGSLSKVLTHFYVFAGRCELGENGRFHINCCDKGVLFIEASTEARFDDWSDMRECTIQELLNQPEDFTKGLSIQEFPLFQIQVTKFSCGGFSIGLTYSEMISDGYSLSSFLKSWSEIHRGTQISTTPLFNGELLKARDPPTIDCDIKMVERNYQVEKSNYTVAEADALVDQQLIQCFVSSQQLQDLIQEVENGPFGYGRPSSFEALSALLWSTITSARELEDEHITKFSYAISCRGNPKRWAPQMIPANFIGNATHASCLPAKAGDIKAKHLSFAARLIHQDMVNQTVEVIKSSVDWIEMKNSKVGFNADYFSGADVDCASLYTFPFYDVDFGYGKPLLFAIMVHGCDGVAYMLPMMDGRNKELYIALPRGHIQKLLANYSFMRFTTSHHVRKSAL